MIKKTIPNLRDGSLIEFIMGTFVAIAFARVFIFLNMEGYLPQPFFYEPQDIWMDWINTAYWAYDKGSYDTWGSIYPPLSFVFLSIFSKESCYTQGEGLASRDCDWISAVALHTFYVINIILIARVYKKIDPRTALPRSFALVAGLPMLAALERGNLILVTFTCFIIGYGPLIRSARLRWLAVGLAINFKVYLLASLFPQLLRRRWRWFEGCIVATVLIYITTYAILGRGTPIEIFRNISDAANSETFRPDSFLDLWFAATYKPMTQLLDSSSFPVLSIIGSYNAELLVFLLPILLLIVQGSIILAAVAAWIRPEAVSISRLTCLGVSFALVTAESGGYIPIFIILFVFMEKWKGFGLKFAIVVSYLISIPGDIVLFRNSFPVLHESFLSGRPYTIYYAVMLGPFIRPLLIMSIPFALSCVTIRAVWADIMQQGWKTRWRYRNDLPIMVGQGSACRPSEVAPSSTPI
jgi:hypothetical protein